MKSSGISGARRAAVVVFLLMVWRAGAAPSVSVLVKQGDVAPGTEEGVTFLHFWNIAVNSTGNVAFIGSLQGSSIGYSNIVGLWAQEASGFELVARPLNPAPGCEEGVHFSGLLGLSTTPWFAFNDRGEAALKTNVDGPGVGTTNDLGIWAGTAATFDLAGREGYDAAVPGESRTFYAFDVPLMSHGGHCAFQARLDYGTVGGLSHDFGIWSRTATGLQVVARSGDSVPGSLGVFEEFYTPAVNRSGQIAFRAFLYGVTDDQGIWSYADGTGTNIALAGDQAPGAAEGALFNQYHPMGDPALNDAGDIVFGARLRLGGTSATNDSGLWMWREEELQALALEGQPAPGTEPGTVFGHFDPAERPTLDGAHAAFRAGLTGDTVTAANDTGIWMGTPSNVVCVVREGDAAPAVGADVYFGAFPYNSTYFSINANGTVAFFSGLTGAGVSSSNNTALWTWNPGDGSYSIVVREGDLLEVAPGDERTIIELKLYGGGGQDGRSTSLNDSGQIAFYAKCTNDFSVVCLAEPGGDAAPDLQVGRPEGGGAGLQWKSTGADNVYRVERSPSLTAPEWKLPEPTNQWPTAATGWTGDLDAAAGFYRVSSSSE